MTARLCLTIIVEITRHFIISQAHKNLSQLPNFAFSVALAHFHRSKVTNSVATADELVRVSINVP